MYISQVEVNNICYVYPVCIHDQITNNLSAYVSNPFCSRRYSEQFCVCLSQTMHLC